MSDMEDLKLEEEVEEEFEEGETCPVCGVRVEGDDLECAHCGAMLSHDEDLDDFDDTDENADY